MPRAVATKYVSGTEISRMRTKITASAPSAMRTSRSGTAAGSTIPAARDASRISVASPMKKTSLPRAPVCQPVTASVWPFGSVPVYQSVNAESVSTSPETHASRTPQLPATGVARSGRGWLRRLHRGSMGTKAHRRARGRAFSEDEEAVQDVEVQLEGSAKGSPAPVEVTLDDSGPTAEDGVSRRPPAALP